jgi:hypothetical protein
LVLVLLEQLILAVAVVEDVMAQALIIAQVQQVVQVL